MDAERGEGREQALEARRRQAQKMESIGQLCGGIAHDFNNILAAILGYTELCQLFAQTRQPERIAVFLDEIHLAAVRARDLVAQLLAFSRCEEASADAVVVAPIVREAVRLLRSTFPATLAIEVDMEDELPAVSIVPVQLHQILMNLGINARDASAAKGRIAIRVAAVGVAEFTACAACHQDFCGDFVRFSVRDDGHGIDPATLPRIFDPFFTTKAVGQGSGLGLSVLHGIVHAAGGHIEVVSAPGCGSEFRVHLPAFRGQRPPPPAGEPSAPLPRLAGSVLVVDDEAAIVGYLATLLESIGCAVTGCTDPAEALRLFRASPRRFDLLVSDQTMPGLTGSELARECLALRPELPVVLCTGYSSHGVSAAAAQALGVRRLLQKPVAAGAFSQLVQELLAETAA